MARQIIGYAVAMVACTLALVPVGGLGGSTPASPSSPARGSSPCASGCYRRAVSGVRKIEAMSVFHTSISYLTVLFVAIAVDPLLPL